jgi:four helix bundle protein
MITDAQIIDNPMIRDMNGQHNGVSNNRKLIRSPWDLEVFKRAYAISLEIHKKTLVFPKIEQYALADQLRRASKSICANIGEGFIKQKYSRAEFARFITIAEASACEVQVWLRYACDLEYITQQEFAKWDDDFQAVGSMLAKLRNKLN